MRCLVIAAIACAALAFTANATRIRQIERTCPIGGEKYMSFDIRSTSQNGMRLDFRPIGPAAHLPWDECPNGFVVFKPHEKFSKAEIAKLTPVVTSPAYQLMRKDHVTAYRVVHLRRVLGESDVDLAWLILKAAWEAEDEERETLRQSYLVEAQRALTARARSMPSRTEQQDQEEWWPASIVVAEIDRQRSRFSESISRLNALPVSKLKPGDISVPLIAQIKEHARKRDPKPAEFNLPNGAKE